MKNSFSIATYNLWKNCGDFPKRIFKIADHLKNIDCICFQEDYHYNNFSSSDTINETLQYNKLTLPIREKKRNGEKSSSNLTILSKYEITLLENIYFNKNKEDERGTQIVQLSVENKKIILINTHLTNLNQEQRIEQIRIIKYTLEEYRSDISIFCGDMNATIESKEIKIIKRCGYNSKNQLPTYEDNLILDYIFYKSRLNIEIDSEIIIKKHSDHYCLQNNFSW